MVKLPTPNWRDLWQTISTHKGLVALVVFLIVVTLTNLPAVNHWLAGWDNFSVSLNLPLNLERTFFATWREYRGFGVPSDSEVADVFRQLPLFALSTFLPDWTVEWIYYFGMYWLGAIGAFFLTQSLVKGIAPFRLTNHGLELAGLVGALAYATNLYTIDVFYFPITLYVVRHGLLPWILWSTHQLLIQSKPSPKLWLWFGLIILLASPGALTATVFFITALMIGLLLLCFGSWQRKLQVGAVLIALQAFWLLPFTNYFLEKSVDITKASTFVPINEMLLNQPFERFSFDRLLTFSTDFTSGAPFKDVSGESVVVHPGLSYTPIGTLPPLAYWSIWIPTLLGIITLLIWQAQHRTWRYSWIIGLLLIGIFLLRKEYPPVGKLFEWLGEHIKVLKVVLRFGGAKLNPILIISTSILSGLAAVGLHELTSKLHRQIPRLILRSLTIISCIAAVSWMGWYALTGSLYFSVMSVEIPDAYFQAAKSINNDPDYGRVLQLPYGVHSYWRSHTFGYYGSSFLAFLLKKPLQDKTFNPGNLDHNAFDQTLTKLIANTSQLTSTARANRATEFANFLARTNTTYLVWDPTVSTFIRTHALTTWELLPTADTDALMQALLDNHLATILGQYELSEWAQPLPTAINNPDVTLKVIKLNTTQAMIASPTIATAIDSIGTEPFTPTLNAIPTTLIQTQKLPARIYPWWQPTAFLTPQDQFLQLTSPTADITKSWQLKNQILQPVTENEYVGVDVFAHYEKQQLAIYFRPTPLPFTPKLVDQSVEPDLLISIPITSWNNPNSKVAYDSYLNNWHVLGDHQTNQFRLSINDQVIPLPANLGEETDYLTSMLLPLGDLRQLPVSLLIADPIAAEQDRQFSGNYFSLTPDPNCWLDKYANFASTFGTSQNTIEATTSHGTLCFGASIDLDQPTQDIAKSKTTDKRRYFELEFVPTITSQLIQTDKTNFPLTNQRELQDQQISEPMISELFVCLMSTATGDCLNQQRFLKSTSPASVRVTSQRLFTEPKLHILMTLPTFGAETQQLHIDHLKLIGFSPQMSSYVSLDATKYATPQVNTDLHLPTISIPYFLSAGSLYTNPKVHGIQVENRGLCQLNQIDRRPTGQQHLTEIDGRLQIYLDNCSTNVSYYLPYFSTNAYWWSVNYRRLAGGQPQFLANTSLLLADELLGLNQGYPFASTTTVPSTAKVLIPSQGETVGKPIELFSITQYTANQSAFELGDTTIFPLPANWQNSYLESGDSTQHFSEMTVGNIQQILPSLWKVQLTKPSVSADLQFLITFNQGFDKQWWLLRGLQKVPAEHLKVNGWANGWLISDSAIPANDTYYFFYWPEILSLIGWSITGLTFILVLRKYVHYRFQPPINHKKERLTNLVKTALQSIQK